MSFWRIWWEISCNQENLKGWNFFQRLENPVDQIKLAELEDEIQNKWKKNQDQIKDLDEKNMNLTLNVISANLPNILHIFCKEWKTKTRKIQIRRRNKGDKSQDRCKFCSFIYK